MEMENHWESDLPLEDVRRYSRQIIVPKVGVAGQRALSRARVLVVGLGGLGSPVLMYLATAGVKTIGVVDYDRVELHNLQRQVIHGEEDVGRNKTESASAFVARLSKAVDVVEHNVRLDDSKKILELVERYDVVADCCDNVQLRYKLNDACRVAGRDLVSASVLRWEGQVCVVRGKGACYRCIFPEMKVTTQSCDTSGVIGPICGVIGSLQASEILKLIMKTDPEDEGSNIGTLIIYNGLTNLFKIFHKNHKICKVCETRTMGSVMSVMCEDDEAGEIEVLSWEKIMEKGEYAIVDLRSKEHFQMFRVHDSVRIPDVEKEVERIREFQKPVAVLCYRGVSSRQAVRILKRHGIKAYSAEGGIEGFKRYMKLE